jgi:hypothetical protein
VGVSPPYGSIVPPNTDGTIEIHSRGPVRDS